MRLFVYGTLKRERALRDLLGRVPPMQEATFPRFARGWVRFHGRRYPIARERADGMLRGIVLADLTATDFIALDAYENISEGPYRRILATVVLRSGRHVRTFVYVAR